MPAVKVEVVIRRRTRSGILTKCCPPSALICRIRDAKVPGLFQDSVEIFAPAAQMDMGARQIGFDVRWDLCQSGIEPNSDDSKIGNLRWQERKQEVPAAELVELSYFILQIGYRGRGRQRAIIQAAG